MEKWIEERISRMIARLPQQEYPFDLTSKVFIWLQENASGSVSEPNIFHAIYELLMDEYRKSKDVRLRIIADWAYNEQCIAQKLSAYFHLEMLRKVEADCKVNKENQIALNAELETLKEN